MSVINLQRLLGTKLFKASNLLINNTKNTYPQSNTIIAKDEVESFVKVAEFLKFVPNSTRKIWYPANHLNLISNKLVVDNVAKNSFFNELKGHRLPFSKLGLMTQIDRSFSTKPVLFNFSSYRVQFNEYCLGHKKKGLSAYNILKSVLTLISNQLPTGMNKNRIFIEITDIADLFQEALFFGFSRDYNNLSALFAKLDVIFISPDTGIIFKPQYTIAAKNRNISLLKLESKLAISSASTNASSDVLEVITDDSVPASDKELLKNSEVLIVDTTEEDKSVDSENNNEEDVPSVKDNPDENDDEALPDDSNTNDEVVDEIPKEVKEDDLVTADLDTILQGSSTNDFLEKVKAENKVFTDKMLPLQEKVLAVHEENADKLSKDKTLDPYIIKDDNIINTKIKAVTTNSITQSYYKKQYKRDLINVAKSLNNDPEHPVVITKFEINNTSTPLNKCNELHVEFVDKKFKKHTFKVNVPTLSHDNFLYINGNKKFIAKQATLIPVIKETNDRVQITTNYRKTFLYRKGNKTGGQIDKILRVLSSGSYKYVDASFGNSVESNYNFNISIPYNYLSKKFFTIQFGGENGYIFYFNQNEIRARLKELKLSFPEDTIPVAIRLFKGKPVGVFVEDIKTRIINSLPANKKEYDNIVDFLTQVIENSTDSELLDNYRKTKLSASLSYTQIKIASTSLSLGVLVASYKGLLPALDSYNISYHMEEKRIAKKSSEVVLAFKDVYLYIDTKYDAAKELFVNGLLYLNTSTYTFAETARMMPIYLEYFEDAAGSRNTAKALLNFESSMIDPITLEVLKELKMPENFVDLLLYGNTLLGDFEHHRKNDMSHFRIRDSEVITVAVYNTLMDAFNNYKRTVRTGVPQPISTKQDEVIKRLQGMTNVEDYSTLNPFLEVEVKSKATFKGPSGLTYIVHYKFH